MGTISGVVVLYNPDETLLKNIESYIDDIDTLFAVDNSDDKNTAIVKALLEHPKIHYIDNHGNQGIANALNVGVRSAIKRGDEWILTMDQDSQATPNMITTMLTSLETQNNSKIALISPYHANKFFPISSETVPFTVVTTPMTSGNLLNLKAYKSTGPFLEKLFIDHVDTEYSLRLQQYGYQLIQANHAILLHNVGELKRHFLFFKSFFSTNHSPVRKYYVYRNSSIILDLYQNIFPDYCKKLRARYWIDLFIVLFYEKQKFAKLRMMLRGYLDYKRGIFGKYHD